MDVSTDHIVTLLSDNDYDSADDYADHDDGYNDKHDIAWWRRQRRQWCLRKNDAGRSHDCHGEKYQDIFLDKHCAGKIRKKTCPNMPQHIRNCNVTHRIALEYVRPPRKEWEREREQHNILRSGAQTCSVILVSGWPVAPTQTPTPSQHHCVR